MVIFSTSERSPSVEIGSSIWATIWGIRGERVPFDAARLIKDALSSGRGLREIEDYHDWLENSCPSAKPA